jgi:glucosylceramidase
MMKALYTICLFTALFMLNACQEKPQPLNVQVFETAANGNKLTSLTNFEGADNPVKIVLNPDSTYQKVTGFGGSFTESSAYLLNKLGKENRQKILEAYFGHDGARYSLTRTHINSCDFSLVQYAYVTEEDKALSTFSVEEDSEDIIPMN